METNATFVNDQQFVEGIKKLSIEKAVSYLSMAGEKLLKQKERPTEAVLEEFAKSVIQTSLLIKYYKESKNSGIYSGMSPAAELAWITGGLSILVFNHCVYELFSRQYGEDKEEVGKRIGGIVVECGQIGPYKALEHVYMLSEMIADATVPTTYTLH